MVALRIRAATNQLLLLGPALRRTMLGSCGGGRCGWGTWWGPRGCATCGGGRCGLSSWWDQQRIGVMAGVVLPICVVTDQPLFLAPALHRLPGCGIEIAIAGSRTGATKRILLGRGIRSPARRGHTRRWLNGWRWCAARQTLLMGPAEVIGVGGDNWPSRSGLNQA